MLISQQGACLEGGEQVGKGRGEQKTERWLAPCACWVSSVSLPDLWNWAGILFGSTLRRKQANHRCGRGSLSRGITFTGEGSGYAVAGGRNEGRGRCRAQMRIKRTFVGFMTQPVREWLLCRRIRIDSQLTTISPQFPGI